MPANLPPQYFEAEKTFREAKTAPEKIAALEDMLAIMPKHKGTDHLKAELRRRIAKLTQTIDKKAATQRASLVIQKEGAAQVLVIGLTNAGKSQLVTALTNASPTVADYFFTTQTLTPGIMEYKDLQIQLVDTPSLIPDATRPWLLPNLMRADGLLVVVDLSNPLAQMEIITTELEKMRIGIGLRQANEEPSLPLRLKKALIVANKVDLGSQNYGVLKERYQDELSVIAISAKEGTGLEELKSRTYQMLDIIRVYTKAPGQKADLGEPIVLPRGSKLEDAAAAVHKDFPGQLKYARIWGSAKHDGTMVKRDHLLQDGDIIELHV